MNKLCSAVAAASLLWAGYAQAHGPTRQKLSESIEINAPPEAVWAIVGDFAHPEKWLPMVESTTAQGGNEKGASRELHLKAGGTLKEELRDYDAEKRVLKYKIVDPTDPKVLPVNNYASEIVVEPGPGGGSKVEWKGAYYRWFLNNNPPADQNEQAANSAVGKLYKEGLANLKAVAEKKMTPWAAGQTRVLLLFAAAALVGPGARAEPFAYITNQKDDTVSVIDTASGQVVKTVQVGSQPAGVAVSRDGAKVVVTNPGSKDITVLDGRTHTVAATLAVGEGPLGVALDPSGARAYVADFYGHYLSVLDLAEGRLVKRMAVGRHPAGVVVSPDGARLYVANREDDSVSSFHGGTLDLDRTVAVGRHPFGLLLDSKAQRLYSANVESNDVSVVDTAAMRVIKTIPVGKRPYALASALSGKRVLVTNQYDNTVSVIDAERLETIGTVPVGEYPEGIASHPDDRHVYVANWFSNTVSVIDALTLTVEKTIVTGDGSRAFGVFIPPGVPCR